MANLWYLSYFYMKNYDIYHILVVVFVFIFFIFFIFCFLVLWLIRITNEWALAHEWVLACASMQVFESLTRTLSNRRNCIQSENRSRGFLMGVVREKIKQKYWQNKTEAYIDLYWTVLGGLIFSLFGLFTAQ